MFGGVRVAHLFSFQCRVFLCFFIFCLRFVSCVVYPMLPLSLDCPYLIARLVFSNVFVLHNEADCHDMTCN